MVKKNLYDDLNDEIPLPEAPYADLYELGFWNQILILKKLCPQLNKFSASKIYEIVREKDEQWQFAEMRWGEAMDFLKEAQKKRLNVIIEEVK